VADNKKVLVYFTSDKMNGKHYIKPPSQNSLSALAWYHTRGLEPYGDYMPIKPGPKPSTRAGIERRRGPGGNKSWPLAMLRQYIMDNDPRWDGVGPFKVKLPNDTVIGAKLVDAR
jgi:hypothetical protein